MFNAMRWFVKGKIDLYTGRWFGGLLCKDGKIHIPRQR